MSSDGKEYGLVGDKMRATDGSMHKYEWDVEATETRYGEKVGRFTKKSTVYSVTLTFRGCISERKRFMDELTNAFESDVANQNPGKIFFGDYYIPCYIISSESGVSETWNNWSIKKIDIYCPYPFWCRDKTYHFLASPEQIIDANMREEIDSVLDNSEVTPDYPYEYPYGFATRYKPAIKKVLYDYKYDYYRNHTVGKLDNDHFAGSDFRMIVYGPCTHPEIRIGGNVYCVSTTLYDSEYMVIDSRGRTVTRYARNGVQENLFNARDKENNVFEKIPPGKSAVKWNAQYPFDVILFQERSEPAWNT